VIGQGHCIGTNGYSSNLLSESNIGCVVVFGKRARTVEYARDLITMLQWDEMSRFVGSSYWTCILRKSEMEKSGIVNNNYELWLSVNSIQGGLPIGIYHTAADVLFIVS
jgi:hypothetical protein